MTSDTSLAFSSGDAFVADVEQSRVLWDDGWDVLDVRASQEIEHFGRFPNPPPGTIGGVFETVVVSGPHKVREVPLVLSSGYRFDPAFGAKVFAAKTKNAAFLESVAINFPDKQNARIMVCCSDGRQRAVAALEALESRRLRQPGAHAGRVQPVQSTLDQEAEPSLAQRQLQDGPVRAGGHPGVRREPGDGKRQRRHRVRALGGRHRLENRTRVTRGNTTL
jgi:hypothetical protein